MARIRRRWISRFQWTLLAFFPAHFAALTFLGRDSPNWLLSLIGALLAGLGLARLFRLREERVLLVQYLHLLGYLSTRLAAGIPLESAFSQAGHSLTEQLGRHNPISRSLMKLKKNLEAQLALQEALKRFSDQVNLPVCKRDFTLLIMLARTGGRIDVFIRQVHEDLSAQISAQEQVAQESRGQSSEALIMSVIPFFIAQLLLDPQSSYGGAVLHAPYLAKTLTFLYLAAMSALFILLMLLAPSATKPKTKRKEDRQRAIQKKVKKTPLTRLLSRLYLDGLPGQLGSSVSSAVQQLADKPDQAWTIYLRQKGREILYSCLFAGALVLTGKVAWYLALLIPLLLSSLRDMASCKKAERLKNEYRFFYPSVISSLHSLLESGLTLDRS
ncbi:MAG TPA: type II secretion system F family protein, partial [Clostridia bacterium]|nr:type II secretion system F family protein [Clostridia bacterium]